MADPLLIGMPLLRRLVEADRRLAEARATSAEPDEEALRDLVAQQNSARLGLARYLVAHGWTPPPGLAAELTNPSLVDVDVDLDVPSSRA